MENFVKVVRLGTVPRNDGTPNRMSIYSQIKYEAGRLSITGVEGPKANGDAWGGCGQIVMHLLEPSGLDGYEAAPGWSATMAQRFLEIWDRWHLNDMQAGSPAQTAYLRENPVTSQFHYGAALTALTAAGLQPDKSFLHEGKPYRYGSAWLRVDVPEDVLQWLADLPDTDTKPAWV